MPEPAIPVELVRHPDGRATGIMIDSFGGLTVLANGAGLRIALTPSGAREVARRLEAVADDRESAEAMLGEVGVAGHA